MIYRDMQWQQDENATVAKTWLLLQIQIYNTFQMLMLWYKDFDGVDFIVSAYYLIKGSNGHIKY